MPNPMPAGGACSNAWKHIAAVEERLLGRLESAGRLDAARVDPEKEAKLSAMVVNRSVRAQAPEPVAPKGRFTSVAQALDHFNVAADEDHPLCRRARRGSLPARGRAPAFWGDQRK